MDSAIGMWLTITSVTSAFGAIGNWAPTFTIPSNPILDAGIDVTFRMLTIDTAGALVQSNDQSVRFN